MNLWNQGYLISLRYSEDIAYDKLLIGWNATICISYETIILVVFLKVE